VLQRVRHFDDKQPLHERDNKTILQEPYTLYNSAEGHKVVMVEAAIIDVFVMKGDEVAVDLLWSLLLS